MIDAALEIRLLVITVYRRENLGQPCMKCSVQSAESWNKLIM